MMIENIINFIVEEENDGTRIDKFLSDHFAEYSRSYIQKVITEEHVFVNEKIVKSNYKLKKQDIVLFSIPKLEELEIIAKNIPLDILYEDEDVIVVNKPKNMVVHPAPGHSEDTLVNGILFHCKSSLSGINGIARPGIVHRIDKDTTGSIIICKNDASHESIAKQLKEHSIVRKYRAICHGVLEDDTYTINKPIGRDSKDRKKMAVVQKNGKEAITHIKVLKRFEKYTYIECQLETGRTHQIRVHLASIHHPILGDEVYSNRSHGFKHLQGQTLHAYTLGFVHPRTNEYIETIAPLPEYFEKLLKNL
ncbi:MAG: RluA family pseudouridine synthase [Lachnospiraceae bacterium]